MREPGRGLFISFEGIDGAGKSTQISMLRTALELQGRAVCTTREPGGDEVGESVRTLLLNSKMHSRTELLLFLAARAQNTQNVILPAMERGEIVLCDRYVDSSVAYQGYARGLDISTIEQLNLFATAELMPHITILLDVAPDVGLTRQQNRNRMEEEGVLFLERARKGFLDLAAKYRERISVFDAALNAEELHRRIIECMNHLLEIQ